MIRKVKESTPPSYRDTPIAVKEHTIRTLKDMVIDKLISLRFVLAMQEGIEDWENESGDAQIAPIEGPVTSGDVQEMIWGLDE